MEGFRVLVNRSYGKTLVNHHNDDLQSERAKHLLSTRDLVLHVHQVQTCVDPFDKQIRRSMHNLVEDDTVHDHMSLIAIVSCSG